MTIGLFILGLISLNFQDVLQEVSEVDQQQTEQENMIRISEAMNTFLIVNAFLPCPDISIPPDGLEDRTIVGGVGRCDSREGNLPYKNFGVKSQDAWGNDYYYRVNQRAESATYITDVCQSASVFGQSGTGNASNLWLCPDTSQYSCKTQLQCEVECPSSCIRTIDPRPNLTSPPYFHLATPPFGTIAGSFNLQIFDEDDLVTYVDGSAVAVAISWGGNGKSVNRYNGSADCVGGTAAELVNCKDDRNFVNIHTGENRDYISWVTMNQAKMALIATGEFQ
ncbi:MAG: hypothetical protein ISEC1_P1515 [Thiomicrorhabdus sp.]|nr:MAG: hypothetical protein ISEC1_P1515 [Thiomicrorhabdus sp.]